MEEDQPLWMTREPDGYMLQYIDDLSFIETPLFETEEDCYKFLDNRLEYGQHRPVQIVPIYEEPDMDPSY